MTTEQRSVLSLCERIVQIQGEMADLDVELFRLKAMVQDATGRTYEEFIASMRTLLEPKEGW